MTAPEPAPTVVSPAASVIPGLTTAEIDRSCRLPVLFLFTAGALWLVLAALFGVITAIKAHGPGFLASPAWLTYGRVRPFAANAFVYGFLIQTSLGVALWMFCRLGRTLLAGPIIIPAAAALWNVGLALGLGLVLAGGSTGYEWLEIPAAATPVLFCAFVLAGAWALVNLHLRRERSMYVSQWFLLAGILWFPWIYATAQVLLVFAPVRGIMQAVVNGWFAHNLFELTLGSFGLASIFYFLPKTLGRPLHSQGLALFGFWLLMLFGGWGGVRSGEPTPNWLGSVSGVARIFLLLPLLAIALCWYGTWRGSSRRATDPILRFTLVAAVSYLATAILLMAAALPPTSSTILYTLFDQGVSQLRLHGFLAMALAGAVYYILPRVSGAALPSARTVQLHFWCAVGGTALTVLALVVGGFVQSAGLNNSQTEFLRVMRSIVPFLGISTLGVTVLCIAYVVFAIAVFRAAAAACPCDCVLAGFKSRVVPARRAKA